MTLLTTTLLVITSHIRTLLVMSLLIATLLVMAILKTLNMGNITDNDITYNCEL
jgi:hypothetical protein